VQQSQPRRTVSWVPVASVTEVKEVAQYFSQHTRGKITVNDVFCSCITGAIAKLVRYHQVQHPELKGLLKLPYMNLVIPVHMQGGILLPGQSMGNKIGAMVNRVPAEAATDPQDRLTRVHSILWNRKQTPAAVWSYLAAKTFGGMGSRLNGWTPWLFEKAHANATVVVTNVRGPETPVHLDGRRVETTLGFLPLPPGIPIGMVIGSYANRLTLTIMAEPSAVPDADLFLSWVVEEYQALLQQAKKGGGTKLN
jgi:diacylglycerol O-acyltransferase